jgi:hypothetical protein
MEIVARPGRLRRQAAAVRRAQWVQNGRMRAPAEWNRSAARLSPLPAATGTDSGRSHRLRAMRRRGAGRALLRPAAAAVPTGTGRRRARWNHGATRRAAMGVDHRRVRSWTCGSRSCGRPLTAHRAGDTADIMLRRTMLRHLTLRVTADRTVRPATAAVAATPVPRAEDIPPVVEDTLVEAVTTKRCPGGHNGLM